jgi:hypothetical protein
MNEPILRTRTAEMRAGDVQVFDDDLYAGMELRLITDVHLADPRERVELSDGRQRYHEDVDLYVVASIGLGAVGIGTGASVGLWPGDDRVYVRREYRIAEEPELFTRDASRDTARRVTRHALRDVIHVSPDTPTKPRDNFSM